MSPWSCGRFTSTSRYLTATSECTTRRRSITGATSSGTFGTPWSGWHFTSFSSSFIYTAWSLPCWRPILTQGGRPTRRCEQALLFVSTSPTCKWSACLAYHTRDAPNWRVRADEILPQTHLRLVRTRTRCLQTPRYARETRENWSFQVSTILASFLFVPNFSIAFFRSRHFAKFVPLLILNHGLPCAIKNMVALVGSL